MSNPADSDSESLCLGCGRCCFGPSFYVQLFEDDLRALSAEQAQRLVVGRDGSPAPQHFMRMENGHCAALDLSGQFRCSIYSQRPLICRVYQVKGAASACPPDAPADAAPSPR